MAYFEEKIVSQTPNLSEKSRFLEGPKDKLDRQSVSRKTITPWYDSEGICLILIVLMVFVFWFGYIGLALTRETSAGQGHSWVPVLLMTSSGIIILSTTIRLVRRYIARRFP